MPTNDSKLISFPSKIESLKIFKIYLNVDVEAFFFLKFSNYHDDV